MFNFFKQKQTTIKVKIVGCYDCGLVYGGKGWIEAVIPDHIWNIIKPKECSNGAGILCITCMSKRLEDNNLKNIPVWICETEPLLVMDGNPSDNLELLRNFNRKDTLN